MNETYIELLASQYAAAKTVGDRSTIVGRALHEYDACHVFVNKHKEGWLGDNGQFARILSKILFQIT